jgi:hypothetical protein
MAEKDPMMNAMEDVTSVAEELHKLHLQVKQYETSSKRMDGISNVLVGLSESVKQMEGKFSNALISAESIGKSVDGLLSSVPDVIGKIEASDAARSISELSNTLTEAKGLIESNRVVVDSLMANMIDDREYHSKTIQSIGDKTECLVKDLAQQSQMLQLINQVLTQNVATSVTRNTKSIAEIKSLIDEVETKSTKKISALETLLASTNALITYEFKMLTEESKFDSETIEDGFKSIVRRLNLMRNLLFVVLGSTAFVLFRIFVVV